MRCWYARWRMSSALDDSGAAALEEIAARGHASRCARCQAHARSLAALHGRLARHARTAGVPAPAPLAAPRPARWPMLVGGAATAAAGVMLVLRAGEPTTLPAPAPPIMTVPTPALEPARTPDGGALHETAAIVTRAATAASAPLETELRALIEDGNRGIGAVLASSGLR